MILPLWTALNWDEWRDPDNLPELYDLGVLRALGPQLVRDRSLDLLHRAGNDAELTDDEEAQLSKIIRRLTSVWAGMTDDERSLLDKYLETSKQPVPTRYIVQPVDPFPYPNGMEPAEAAGIIPHPYQRRAIMFSARPRSVLALEMGLGKTLIALVVAHLARERDEINRVLVIAPRSAHSSWRDHLTKFTTTHHVIISGCTPSKRESVYTEFYHGQIPFLVVTPQTFALDARYFERIADHHGNKTQLIIDEAHRAKSIDSLIGVTVERVAKQMVRVLALTGTPQPNEIGDLYHLIHRVTDGALGSLSEFASRYTYREIDQWDSVRGTRYKAGPLRADRLEELHGRLHNIMLAISVNDDDVSLNLPSRLDVAPYISMDDYQHEIMAQLRYATAEREINTLRHELSLAGEHGELMQIAAEGATANIQALGIRLEQLAISPALFSETFKKRYPTYESPKLRWVVEYVSQYLNSESSGAVVFCEYVGGLEIMQAALIRRGVAPHQIRQYTGTTSEKHRLEAIQALNEGKCRVLLGQTKALETGANLQKNAALVAHLSTPWSPDTLAQSTARVYRQGQTKRVIVLRPSGSRIEEAKNTALARKLIQSGAATGLFSEADAAIIQTAADPRVRRAHRDIAHRMRYTAETIATLAAYEEG